MEATTRKAPPDPASDGLPETLYRKHVVDCDLPENAFTFDFMSDYLTMMDTLSKSMSRELDAACALTPLQYRILIRIAADEGVHAKDLADALDVRVSTISTAVNRLASRTLIERREDAKDMRIVRLGITACGTETLARADRTVKQLTTEYWASLSAEQLDAATRSSISAVRRHSAPRFENGSQRLDTALLETVMISRSLTTRCLQEHGLAVNDYRVLLALKIMGGACAASDIARFLFLSSCDITASLKNLEAMRCITRQRCEENRRIRMVELTPTGDARTIELLPLVFDALLETCHSDDELIRVHISSARDLVARKRHRSDF